MNLDKTRAIRFSDGNQKAPTYLLTPAPMSSWVFLLRRSQGKWEKLRCDVFPSFTPMAKLVLILHSSFPTEKMAPKSCIVSIMGLIIWFVQPLVEITASVNSTN